MTFTFNFLPHHVLHIPAKFEVCMTLQSELIAHFLAEHYLITWPWSLTFRPKIATPVTCAAGNISKKIKHSVIFYSWVLSPSGTHIGVYWRRDLDLWPVNWASTPFIMDNISTKFEDGTATHSLAVVFLIRVVASRVFDLSTQKRDVSCTSWQPLCDISGFFILELKADGQCVMLAKNNRP